MLFALRIVLPAQLSLAFSDPVAAKVAEFRLDVVPAPAMSEAALQELVQSDFCHWQVLSAVALPEAS